MSNVASSNFFNLPALQFDYRLYVPGKSEEQAALFSTLLSVPGFYTGNDSIFIDPGQPNLFYRIYLQCLQSCQRSVLFRTVLPHPIKPTGS